MRGKFWDLLVVVSLLYAVYVVWNAVIVFN
jgi:hypothetical protein